MSNKYSRLKKVANSTHEEFGLKFDFEKICLNITKKHPCGSTGCKIQLFPFLFPKKFQYDKKFRDIIFVPEQTSDWSSFAKFFNITCRQFCFLFGGYTGINRLRVGSKTIKPTSENSTEQQVNDNIKKFIKLKLYIQKK